MKIEDKMFILITVLRKYMKYYNNKVFLNTNVLCRCVTLWNMNLVYDVYEMYMNVYISRQKQQSHE